MPSTLACLLLPPTVSAQVSSLQASLEYRPLLPPHLTLLPPVLDPVTARTLAARLERAAAHTPEITVAIGPPATFLPRAPVVYLEVTGAGLPWLHALHRELAEAVGLGAGGPPFVPHVTLVRELERSALLACLAAARAAAWQVTVASVHLLSVTDDGETRTWRELRQFALDG